jgi:hypothetical protein
MAMIALSRLSPWLCAVFGCAMSLCAPAFAAGPPCYSATEAASYPYVLKPENAKRIATIIVESSPSLGRLDKSRSLEANLVGDTWIVSECKRRHRTCRSRAPTVLINQDGRVEAGANPECPREADGSRPVWVRDADTAIKLAKAVLKGTHYNQFDESVPIVAARDGDRWAVYEDHGPCPPLWVCHGASGSPVVTIRTDGKIDNIHYQRH